MLDFSYIDPRLLFPNMAESWILAIESLSGIWDIVSIFLIFIAEWMLFKKFGEKPWKSLVPYYNSFILYKYSWSKKAFWVYIISSTLFDFSQGASKYLAQNSPDDALMTLLVLISLPFGILAAVCSILYAFRLAEAFGKGKAFSIGLLLAYPVFIAILGIGKIKYLGNCSEYQTMNETDSQKFEGEAV